VNILKITFKSVKRRYRQIIRAALTTLLAVFFVTAVLIFQENMYQWQMQSNKDRFGDWFVMDIGSKNPDSNLTDNSYIKEPVKVPRSVYVLNSDWENTGFYVGSLPQDFIKQSHIKLDEGKQPGNSDEIAMDWNTLLSLGYTGEIGEDITLYYSENNSISNEDKRKTKTYKLVGIYRNYTNIWNNGKQIPSAIVSEDELQNFKYDTRYVYIYPIKDSAKIDDYNSIFNSLNEATSKSYIYNSGVYDYKPWGSANIYLYMYLIVMAIGITALSYQLIEYKNTRKQSFKKYAALGADSSQLKIMYIIENALIIIPAAIIGIAIAFLAGGIIGHMLEQRTGFAFYTVNSSVILKSIISVVIAVIIEEIVGLFSNINAMAKEKRLKNRSRKTIVPVEVHKSSTELNKSANIQADSHNSGSNKSSYNKSKLKAGNLYSTITHRLMKRDGAGVIIGVRLFALFICIVLIFSVMKISTSIKEYKSNDSLPDIYGYLDPASSNYITEMNYITYLKDYDSYPSKSFDKNVYTKVDFLSDAKESYTRYPMKYDEIYELFSEQDRIQKFFMPLVNKSDRVVMSEFRISNSQYMKDGNTNLMSGIQSEIIDGLSEIPGIVSFDYSIYETERAWYWDNQDYHKMGSYKYGNEIKNRPSGVAAITKDPVYGDRYMYATEYVKPTKQIYDIAGKYIDKENISYEDFASGKQVIVFIQDNCEGEYDDTLKAGDTLYYNYYNIPFGNCRSYIFGIEKYPIYPYDIPFFNKYNNSGKIDLYVTEVESTNTQSFDGTQKGLEIETLYGACVSPKVAAVIKVTDEVKADFNGIIPDYGYYTSLASEELAKQALDNQKDLMRRITGEELTDGIDFELQYNQIRMNYDLSSTFSATNNKVALYLKSNNITYKSNVDSKNVYRTQLVNNILQYGITIFAVVIIQLLIMAIIIRNRIAGRRDKFLLFRRMGMTKGKLLGICMREALRESLWCIFTVPLMLLVELLIYYGSIRRLK